jgi:hypothetical protein
LENADITFLQLVVANEAHPARRNSTPVIGGYVQIDGPYLATIKLTELDGPIFVCEMFRGIFLGDGLAQMV